MDLQTKYITTDEFKQYFGIDLVEELGSVENAIAFIKRIEDRIATFLDCEYYQKVDYIYGEFTNYQKEHYKLALLEQAIYVFKGGDRITDNAVDENGNALGRSGENWLAPMCKANLVLCGLINREVYKNSGRGGFFWGGELW